MKLVDLQHNKTKLKENSKNLQCTLHLPCKILQGTFKTDTIQCLIFEKSKLIGSPRETCCRGGDTLTQPKC